MIGGYIIPRKDGNVQRQRVLLTKRAALAGFSPSELRLYIEEHKGRALANMIADAKAHRISAVLTANIEAFGASASTMLATVEEIVSTGARLIVLEGDVDITPLGDAARLCRAVLKAKRKTDTDTRSTAQKKRTGRPRHANVDLVMQAVNAFGNVSAAAHALQIPRSTVRRAYLAGVADGRVA